MTSTTRNILIGLALGVATGLFLGEKAGGFQLVAEAYLRLLQMTVLPYVMVSLIEGIGSLDGARARRLFVRVGTLSLVLWALALGAVMLMPLAFPAIESASFFSTTLVEARPPLDFVALYIPSNPFHSLANNIVPAVVLFSIFVGVALIGIERKQGLLENLMLIERGLKRANQFAVSLTPIGLFAIAAQMVGTVDAAQFDRVRVYLIAYAAMTLLLSLWVLPGLVACLTPIPVHQILNKTRDALITAFTTGELFIVLPILIDRSKELLITHGLPEPEEGSPPEVIVPAFYNFPHAAKLLSLSFVLFAAWYSQTLLNLTDYPVLVLAGIVSLFGSINVALPFLLDLVKIPADTFQLFLTTGVINARFGTLTSAMYMITLALAGSYALVGNLRFSPARILRYALVTTGLTVATLAATGGLLRILGAGTYDKDRLVEEMKLLRPPAVRATVLRALPSASASREAASVLEAMRARGRIRVGYVDDAMPYSYFNGRGELVGFDVEMAYTLAGELGLEIEFVPVPRERWPRSSTRVFVTSSWLVSRSRRGARVQWSSHRPTSTRRLASWFRTIDGPISQARSGSALLPACGLLFPTFPISRRSFAVSFRGSRSCRYRLIALSISSPSVWSASTDSFFLPNAARISPYFIRPSRLQCLTR